MNKDIHRGVVAQAPADLLRAVSLTKLYKEKYFSLPSPRSTPFTPRNSTLSASNNHNTQNTAQKYPIKNNLPPLLPTPNVPPIRNNDVKKIRPAEMQLRREKGLCYFCDEKFSFNHKCPNRQLLLLQYKTDDAELECHDSEDKFDSMADNSNVVIEDHHLSLNALKGGMGVSTIRFMAYIGKLPVKALVDRGSSNNFL